MKKILLIFGTRPEAIKLAPAILKLRAKSKELRTIICVTAQHREMLDQVLDIFQTKDKYNPFPEEINRRLTDCLADLYFVHTKQAKENLLREGVDKKKIFVTGNTVIDALMMIVKKQNNKRIQKEIKQNFILNYGISLDNKKLILVTGHRRESFGRDFENICKGLKKIDLSI